MPGLCEAKVATTVDLDGRYDQGSPKLGARRGSSGGEGEEAGGVVVASEAAVAQDGSGAMPAHHGGQSRRSEEAGNNGIRLGKQCTLRGTEQAAAVAIAGAAGRSPLAAHPDFFLCRSEGQCDKRAGVGGRSGWSHKGPSSTPSLDKTCAGTYSVLALKAQKKLPWH